MYRGMTYQLMKPGQRNKRTSVSQSLECPGPARVQQGGVTAAELDKQRAQADQISAAAFRRPCATAPVTEPRASETVSPRYSGQP